jgi:Flp pilus assembly protein TadG
MTFLRAGKPPIKPPMRQTLREMRQTLRDEKGGVAVTFALSLLPLLGCVALAVDVATWYSARTQMQAIADGAAIASARELRIGHATSAHVTETARRYALSAMQYGAANAIGAEVTATVSNTRNEVTVAVASEVSPLFSRFVSTALVSVSVEATARLSGTIPVCMVGIDEKSANTVQLADQAELTAGDCGIYSNSTNTEGLVLKGSSRVLAARICSGGGFVNHGASAVPTPQADCPSLGDPLEQRGEALSKLNPCTDSSSHPYRFNGNQILSPTSYCNGIVIGSSAQVHFQPGIYHVGGRGLVVDSGARLTGSNVSFHFKGKDAQFFFGEDTSINLSATKEGPMAGILFFEDPSASKGKQFRISSNDARNLLGTIYLPKGDLIIDSQRAIAGDSAYTVIVARRITMTNGPKLILNTNYSATDVPVPEGVGPNAKIHLSQ